MDIFDEMFRMTRRLRFGSEERVQPLGWRPAADVYRIPQGWLIKFELAGVRPEDIDLHVGGRVVTVSGRRYDCDLVEGCQFHSLEISYSQFQRAIALPQTLEGTRISTEFRQGMLLVRITMEESHT
ncbi:MAG TPA: Hsp20/alpha crystallin family protein [Gammaproteobacteria bacterium]|nr:Hsp20/alpha crystallin family protein [Gammaproteobacteria bacterium]